MTSARDAFRRSRSSTSENIRPLRKIPSSSIGSFSRCRANCTTKLVEIGINPDRVSQSTTKNIMAKLNERFHPADSIGYAYVIARSKIYY